MSKQNQNRSRKSAVVIFTVTLVFSACSSPPPASRDKDLARISALAFRTYERGEVAQAEDLYRQALLRAMAIDDSRGMGNSAYNLASCMFDLNQFDEARQLLTEAQAQFAKSVSVPPEVYILEARVADAQGFRDEAILLASQAEVVAVKAGKPQRAAEAGALKSELYVQQGNITAARDALDKANEEAGRNPSPALQARLLDGAAGIEAKEGASATAAQSWEKAAQYYRKAERYISMVNAMEQAAGAWAGMDKWEAAWPLYYQAAAARFGQGNPVHALGLIKSAMLAAEKLDDKASMDRTMALFSMIKSEVEKQEKRQRGTP